MENYLDQLNRISSDYSSCENKPLPVIIAGDIFDKWNSPPELINFVMKRLPKSCYAIPGQHDLPFHNLQDIKRSAYWTLVEAGAVTNMEYDSPTFINDKQIMAWAFPWESKLRNIYNKLPGALHLAVIHKYVWIKGSKYTGAPAESYASVLKKATLSNYDAVVTGDNHKGFHDTSKGGPQLFNCGGFIRRTTDQETYRPMVGILHKGGHFTKEYLNCSTDKLQTVDEALSNVELGLHGLYNLLTESESSGLDFMTMLRLHLTENKKKISKYCLQILSQLIDETVS